MLEKVKTALGITGTYQDALLQIYIDDVVAFLLDAGVSVSVVNSDAATGIIVRGVADLWNYGSGGTSFSQYFLQRAIQLTYKTSSGSSSSSGGGGDGGSSGDDTPVEVGDYNTLVNKPSIEGTTLEGNSTLNEFGVEPLSSSEISNITKWE